MSPDDRLRRWAWRAAAAAPLAARRTADEAAAGAATLPLLDAGPRLCGTLLAELHARRARAGRRACADRPVSPTRATPSATLGESGDTPGMSGESLHRSTVLTFGHR
jgi:hypothetical protein